MVTDMLGRGLYTFPEAGRLAGLRSARVRDWFVGRGKSVEAVFVADFAPVDGDYAISFHDLVDAHIAGHLRESGVSLQTIRQVYNHLKSDFATEHPFCRREMRTDGKNVFLRGLDSQGREEILEALTKQRVFPDIIRPFLKRLDYSAVTKLAERWHIAEGVLLDPQIGFGKPVIESDGIATEILASAYYANGDDANLVASWYDIDPRKVLQAVEFEQRLVAA